jgi:hypothetical protein
MGDHPPPALMADPRRSPAAAGDPDRLRVRAVAAIVAAHYGDGVIRPRPFILADQAPVIFIFALHIAAVVEMHARQTTADVLQATLTAMDTEAGRLRPPGPSSG